MHQGVRGRYHGHERYMPYCQLNELPALIVRFSARLMYLCQGVRERTLRIVPGCVKNQGSFMRMTRPAARTYDPSAEPYGAEAPDRTRLLLERCAPDLRLPAPEATLRLAKYLYW